MAFHVPYNQRHSQQHSRKSQQNGIVYIGFEKPRKKFNWWGFHGLWMSLASFVTLGFTSIVPLLISLNGMRKSKGPRTAATFGFIFSLMGGCFAGGLLALACNTDIQRAARQRANQVARDLQVKTAEAETLLTAAVDELVQYRNAHDGNLPSIVDANIIVLKHVDPWGVELRFDGKVDRGIVRSSGPDKKYETRDDITVTIEGKTEVESSLLPLQ